MRPCSILSALLVALALLGTSCGDRGNKEKAASEQAVTARDAGAAPVEQDQEKTKRLWEQMIGLMEQLAEIAQANQGDCDKMALEIDRVLQKHKKFLTNARAVRKANPDDPELQEKYQPRIMQAMDKLVPPMKACKDNDALARAMKQLGD